MPATFTLNLGTCETFWGSHGCMLKKGHPPEVTHKCDCCDCDDHLNNNDPGCVGDYPYYGPFTHFYGDDAPITLIISESIKKAEINGLP